MSTVTSLLAQASGSQDAISNALGALDSVLQYAGTVAFAISGALLAVRKRMDIVGVVVLGVIVAVGGGTLRDLLLGDLPVFWVDDPTFVVVGAATALATIPLSKRGAIKMMQRYDLVALTDAAGLALFAVTGTGIALDAGANWLAAALVGVIAGVGGGIIRDVLANQVPDVLASGEFYATAALAGTLLYALLLELDVDPQVAVWLPILVIFTVRASSVLRGWGVPRVGIGDADTDSSGRG
jgi:uncharacterized membrane protein YeiH